MSNRPNFRKMKAGDARALMSLCQSIADRPADGVSEFAALADGYEIEGGCKDCSAYQTIKRDPKRANVSHITVHHDDDCPTLAQMKSDGAA